MGYYLSVLFLVIAVALQHSLLPNIRYENGQPELVLIIVLSWSVHASWEEAFWWAFFGGAVQDLMGVVPLGTSVLGLLVLVFGIRYMADQLLGFNPLFLLGFAVLGTLLQHGILFLVLTMTIGAPDLAFTLETFTIPSLLMNMALILPVYFVLRLFQRRIPEPQSAW